MTTRIMGGHVLDRLRELPSESVHTCITSPPYWGLREYGTPPQVWESTSRERYCDCGRKDFCTADCGTNHLHEWRPAESQRRIYSEAATIHGATSGVGKKLGVGQMGRANALPGDRCSCGAWLGSLGLEPTPELFVEHLTRVFEEVRRVLRSDGTLWLNLGDSFSGSGRGPTGHNGIGNQTKRQGFDSPGARVLPGLKPKDLVGVPWMVAFALRAAGWYLRSDIIWSKPNPMPESVTDRPTKAHEYVFLLSKSRDYFYDADAIKEQSIAPVTADYSSTVESVRKGGRKSDAVGVNGRNVQHVNGEETRRDVVGGSFNNNPRLRPDAGRNKRSVWEIATAPFSEAHFATFPPKLIEPMIKAGTSERGCCLVCQAPWERITQSTKYSPPVVPAGKRFVDASRGDKSRKLSGADYNEQVSTKTVGWRPTCVHYDDRYRAECPQARSPRKRAQRAAWGDWWRRARRRPGNPSWPTKPCMVLDPFGGAGTTALVAERFGRDAVLIDLNTKYAEMALKRIVNEAPLFNMVETV